MEELLDILDESGRPTGEVVAKSEAHRLGLWHRCFHCWICGSEPGGSYLLLQRRAATKDTWPGYLDVTAAGHLAAGEGTLDGLREVEEELGLRWRLRGSSRSEPAGWSRRYPAAATGSFTTSSSCSTPHLRGTCVSRRRRSRLCFGLISTT